MLIPTMRPVGIFDRMPSVCFGWGGGFVWWKFCCLALVFFGPCLPVAVVSLFVGLFVCFFCFFSEL